MSKRRGHTYLTLLFYGQIPSEVFKKENLLGPGKRCWHIFSTLLYCLKMLGKISSTPLRLCFRGFFCLHMPSSFPDHWPYCRAARASSNPLAKNQGFILQKSGIPRLTHKGQTYYAASLSGQAIIAREQISEGRILHCILWPVPARKSIFSADPL